MHATICAAFHSCLLLTQSLLPVEPATGPWDAWLDSPGGKLRFGIELASDGEGWSSQLVNGSERIPVPATRREGDELVFDIAHYDSRIRAKLVGDGSLRGSWEKRSPSGWTRMGFAAAPRAKDAPERDGPAEGTQLSGRWKVQFEKDDNAAVGVFEQSANGQLAGTFLTTLGDYRFLAGDVRGRTLELSCFDGAHAFLFRAELGEDGQLRGDFWSRDAWHETWTAVRDENASLPDPFELSKVQDPGLDELRYPDLEGKVRSLDDPAFAGRARILQVFGTWCPNCKDASRFMVELHERYADRGLSIVGLAFEHTGDLERDTQQVRVYRDIQGIGYPLLVAGLSDKKKASEAFPLLERVIAYPTTIFFDHTGKVRAVHTGFSGPATGEEHTKLRADFERLIDQLLSEAP